MSGKKHSLTIALGLAILFMVLATGTPTAAQTETILHTFTSAKNDGGYPRAGLIFDRAGNLYGTTSKGGSTNGGTVYELKPTGSGEWSLSVVYSFPYAPQYGADEISGLTFDNAGNLYGTTPLGGSSNDGRLFELVPKAGGGWSEVLLHNFGQSSTDGVLPNGVVADAAGNLYGTTVYGGTEKCEIINCGTVFKMTKKNGHWVEEVLYNFQNNGSDGTNPYFGVTLDSAGNVYGTTEYGGAYGQGTVYEVSPTASGGWTEQVIHSFGASGDTGYGQTLIFNGGNLYGATSNGGSGAGEVFELTPTLGGSWTEQILYSFPYNPEGQTPEGPGGILMDGAGNIYGLAGSGGTGLDGAVFELTPQAGGTWAETTLYNFNYYASGGIDGAQPTGTPVLDSQGNLYGVTVYGGTDDAGIVFEIAP
jgi:uncharacterized repeat protein (TIGR03803 family)